jgi:dihydrofolate reductase
MNPEHIADPESDSAFQQAMERNDDDAPEETDPAPHWHRDRAVVVRTSNRLSVEAAREAAKATEALLQASARPPLTMIIAIARNGVIGKGDKIPWPISEDLRHFKRETMGHTLVVGRKTALSLPPLPGRSLVVLSRAATAYGFTDGAATIEDAIARARKTDPHPFVIGGAEVYRAAMPFVTRILLTEIDHDYEGDVRFELDRTGFVETSRCAGETPGVSFVTLERGSAS